MSALLATTAGSGIATGGEVGETRYGGWGVGLRLLGHPEATRPYGSSLLPKTYFHDDDPKTFTNRTFTLILYMKAVESP